MELGIKSIQPQQRDSLLFRPQNQAKVSATIDLEGESTRENLIAQSFIQCIIFAVIVGPAHVDFLGNAFKSIEIE